MLEYFFLHYFQRKITNAMVKVPLVAKGAQFKPFLKFSFSSMNKMDDLFCP